MRFHWSVAFRGRRFHQSTPSLHALPPRGFRTDSPTNCSNARLWCSEKTAPKPRVCGQRAASSRTQPARAGNWRCLDVSGSKRDTIGPSLGTPEAQMSFSNEDEAVCNERGSPRYITAARTRQAAEILELV